jgi:hypothetical protein
MFFAGINDEFSTMADAKAPARQAVSHGAICAQVNAQRGE